MSESSIPPEIRESVPERQLATPMVNEIMKALNTSDEAAYKVWLLLSTKFGAGQKLWR